MENIREFFEKNVNVNIVTSLIIILISFMLYRTISFLLNKSESKDKFRLFTSNKAKTYVRLVRSVIRAIFIIVTFLIVLSVNGINVNSLLTGVGIVGVIFGFAIQDWLKDAIRGSCIISDNYFKVGDIIKYKDIIGKVLVIGIKTTKIKDLGTKNIVSIANRNIEEVEIVSDIVHIVIPVPYEVSVEKAEKAIADIVKKIKKNDNVKDCVYIGITDLASSSINYKLEVYCVNDYRLQVRRDALKSVLLGLADNNIEVPFTQIDVHNK